MASVNALCIHVKEKYPVMNDMELKRLKDLDVQNQRLKQVYSELALDYERAKRSLQKGLVALPEKTAGEGVTLKARRQQGVPCVRYFSQLLLSCTDEKRLGNRRSIAEDGRNVSLQGFLQGPPPSAACRAQLESQASTPCLHERLPQYQTQDKEALALAHLTTPRSPQSLEARSPQTSCRIDSPTDAKSSISV